MIGSRGRPGLLSASETASSSESAGSHPGPFSSTVSGTGTAAPHSDRRPRLDVTGQDTVDRAVRQAGEVDVLVSNAGTTVRAPPESVPLPEVERLFPLSTLGALRVTQAVLPAMRQRGAGRLVVVSGIQGRLVLPLTDPCGAGGWALQAPAETLTVETGRFGVRVSFVQPGVVSSGGAERAEVFLRQGVPEGERPPRPAVRGARPPARRGGHPAGRPPRRHRPSSGPIRRRAYRRARPPNASCAPARPPPRTGPSSRPGSTGSGPGAGQCTGTITALAHLAGYNCADQLSTRTLVLASCEEADDMTDETEQGTRSRHTASRRRVPDVITVQVQPVLAVPIPGGEPADGRRQRDNHLFVPLQRSARL